MNDFQMLSMTAPLPVALPVVTIGGREILGVKVNYEVMAFGDGMVLRSTTVFDATSDNRGYQGHTDLPDDIPDAPQWFLDAAEAFLTQAGESR